MPIDRDQIGRKLTDILKEEEERVKREFGPLAEGEGVYLERLLEILDKMKPTKH